AAAEALLRIPGPTTPLTATRIVEVLGRSLTVPRGEPGKRTALVAVADEDYRDRVREAVEAAGLRALPVRTGRDAMRRLRAGGDIDVILLDSTLPLPGLAPLLGQLRADVDVAKVPVLLAAVPEARNARDILTRYRRVRTRLEGLNRSTRRSQEALAERAHERQLQEEGVRKNPRLSADERVKALRALDEKFAALRRDIGSRFPESVLLLRDAPKLEGEMRKLAEDYDREVEIREGSL